MSVVGRSVRPIDWVEKTSGTARYASDAPPAGTLVARVLRAPVPHARIQRLDVSEARRVPGVRAIVTAADFAPGVMYEHSGEPYSDRSPLAVDRVLYVGHEVAAVAADTAEAAEEALRRIVVRYRRLPAVLSVPAALDRRAPLLHKRPSGTNVALATAGHWGDLELATRNAVTSVEGTFRYPRVNHACMEPNTTIAWWHDERLELWTSSQAPHFVVHELSRVLGLRLDQVVCRDVSVGGGFGSKSKVSEHEALAAALSMKCGQPVLLELSRAEEFAFTKPRHAFTTTLVAHTDADDRICFLDVKVDVDNGAYNHFGPSVMRAGIKQLGSMYRPDAVRWDARLVDTNLVPGGQFRGYGQPQTAIALESAVDELAERCGRDPLEFRIHNASRPDTQALAGALIGSNRLVECLQSVRERIGWDEKRRAKRPWRGVGVASGMHASGSYAYPGGNVSAAGVEVTSTGDVVVRFGGADAGTGQRTILGQIAAEVLDVPFDRVRVIMSDWDETPPDMGAWSSRGTHMGGHATRQTAQAVADRLLELGAAKLGTSQVRLRAGRVESAGAAVEIGELVELAPESANGSLRIDLEYLEKRMQPYWTGIDRPNISASYSFTAHAVEVEVDPDTGVITILDYVAAHDIGRAINPALVTGQVIGGVVQGLGAALGERLIHEGGRVVNPSYLHYSLPRATAVPSIDVELIEGPEPAGPFNAKSVGEVAIIPSAPALLNAVYAATGIRFRELPLTPDVVLAALREHAGTPPRRHHLARRPSRWQIELFRRLYPLGLHHLLDRVGTRWARRPEPRPVEAIGLPATVADAVAALAAPDAVVLGGGSDLIVQRDQALTYPRVLVGTSRISAMRTIDELPDGALRIGAAATLTELGRWADGRMPLLAEAIDTIASAQIREVATVGGNLGQAKRCWFFRNGFDCYKRGGVTCPCYAVSGDHRLHHAAIGAHRCQAVTPSDLATVFAALDAQVRIAGPSGARITSIAGLFKGPGELRLRPAELIESVSIAADARGRSGAFAKLQQWDGDFALVSVAASVSIAPDGRWESPRFAFGGLAATPWIPQRLCAELSGTRPTRQMVTSLLSKEFEWQAHPLPGTRWKLDAAVGLSGQVTDRLLGGGGGHE
ncbi:molybdopterin cofactor-binding domain-containing protein [Dactylosporangium sp. NPDC000555]|uniref:molybdopterin cofactor-binding domain-containing protein n=1 Tax=Dactylosporangium sp. NPDC000555 TaxID=3154260 RepID=UPI00331BA89F